MSFDRTGEHYRMNLRTYTIARDKFEPNENYYQLIDAESITPQFGSAALDTKEKLYFTADLR